MSFPNSQTGWCVGDYGLAIHTNDGGQSWKQVKVPTEVALNSIHFVDSNVGYITGRKEVYDAKTRTSTFGVIILKTDDAGKNWNTSYEDNETASVWQIATLSKKWQ